jgi:serine/threonine-protein kinase RsbT
VIEAEHLDIAGEDDIVMARQRARDAARTLGFGLVDQSRIATAVSELARNVVRYATNSRGLVAIRPVQTARGSGLEIVVSDEGPGIADIETAMRRGFTSGPGLGMGLPGTNRLMDAPALTVDVREQADVERVRRDARVLADRAGFSREEAETVALAVSELATNLLRYATLGRLEIAEVRATDGASRIGLVIESRDGGPGIADAAIAMQDGFSTGGGLGAGLGSVRRLMDEFQLSSGPSGTSVVCRKWHRPT